MVAAAESEAGCSRYDLMWCREIGADCCRLVILER